ncbi:MAG: hypothetical protein WCY70_09085 [Methanoculleus sp.]
MTKSAYCGYCGREFLLKDQAVSGSIPFCSVECLEAAAKQDAAPGGNQTEKLLVSGRSPWSR